MNSRGAIATGITHYHPRRRILEKENMPPPPSYCTCIMQYFSGHQYINLNEAFSVDFVINGLTCKLMRPCLNQKKELLPKQPDL